MLHHTKVLYTTILNCTANPPVQEGKQGVGSTLDQLCHYSTTHISLSKSKEDHEELDILLLDLTLRQLRTLIMVKPLISSQGRVHERKHSIKL